MWIRLLYLPFSSLKYKKPMSEELENSCNIGNIHV